MSAALVHVFRGVDSEAQWGKAVCSLAGMDHLGIAQTQLHLLRALSESSDSWARLAVVESQCQMLVSQALAEVRDRREYAVSREEPLTKPETPRKEVDDYTSAASSAPSSAKSDLMSNLRERIASMAKSGRPTQEITEALTGRTPAEMYTPPPPVASAVDTDSEEFTALFDRVIRHHDKIKRGGENPMQTAQRLYSVPGFRELLGLDDAQFVVIANRDSPTIDIRQIIEDRHQAALNNVKKARQYLSEGEVRALVQQLLMSHTMEQLTNASPDDIKKMVDTLPKLTGSPMSPQFHALKPPPAKIITDKAMLIKPEEPPSPQISVASPSGSTASNFSMASNRDGGGLGESEQAFL
jgi:hypothetical protein